MISILAVDPPQFDYTKTILAASGIATLIVGIISAVIQYFLKASSDQKLATYQREQTQLLETFKDSLKRDSDLEFAKHNNKLSLEMEHYKNELQRKGDAELETLKHALKMNAFIHETRFQKMHEKQAEVIAGVHALIQNAIDALAACASHQLSASKAVPQKQMNETFNAMEKIKHYLNENQLYLSEELVGDIDDVWFNMYPIYLKFYETINVGQNNWDHFATSMKNSVEPLLGALRSEFRRIIGVDGSDVPKE